MKSNMLSMAPFVAVSLMTAVNAQLVVPTLSSPIIFSVNGSAIVLPAPTLQIEPTPVEAEDVRSLFVRPFTPVDKETDRFLVKRPEATVTPFSKLNPL